MQASKESQYQRWWAALELSGTGATQPASALLKIQQLQLLYEEARAPGLSVEFCWHTSLFEVPSCFSNGATVELVRMKAELGPCDAALCDEQQSKKA